MKKVFIWFPSIIWMGVIFYLSSQPYEQQNLKPLIKKNVEGIQVEKKLSEFEVPYRNGRVSVESHGLEGFIEFFIRKGAHITVFFILFLLLFYSFSKSLPHLSIHKVMVYTLLTVTLYACLDEFHQSFTPHRTPYIGDVGIDVFGGMLAILTLYFLYVLNKRKSQNG